MFGRTRLLKATALALPFSLAAAAAHAASIAETVLLPDATPPVSPTRVTEHTDSSVPPSGRR